MLPKHDIPAPGFRLVSGKRKPSEGKYNVQFRNGYVCKWAYGPNDLRWLHERHDWDVVAVQHINDVKSGASWNPKSGGY